MRAPSSPFPLRRSLFPSLFLLLAAFLPATALSAVISDYQVLVRAGCGPSGRTLVAIRSFREDGVPHLLAVDPATLATVDLPAASFRDSGTLAALKETPFLKALRRYTTPPCRLQNQGATHDERGGGVFLTVDLCPSKRPFERELFETVESLSWGRPSPVALAVSGAWLLSHPKEISQLKEASDRGLLAITWVNHSLHHPYDPKLPLAGNFLLTPGTDFDREVLQVEEILLSQGLVPSPFFRFPGLVADGATLKRLSELSLIPLGSNAWLAKGEPVEPGSFILVHGNGNEPKGVKLLLPMLRTLKLRALPEAFCDGPP